MALRKLMLRRDAERKAKDLDEVRKAFAALETREAELEKAIDEVNTEEERDVVMAEIEKFETEKAENEEKRDALEKEIRELETEIEELEKKDEAAPADPEPAKDERKDETNMEARNFKKMTMQERTAFFAREDVKAFLQETRDCIKNKRALTNVGLTIPEVFLGVLRENIAEYSKLYKHVYLRQISGEGRVAVMGTIPEAVWTDCCANLNELDLSFNDAEVNCWRVGGYYAVCNANLEDSDVDLASEIITALGAGIGLALDKAILYGTGSRMPLGVVTRLAQTSQPADYPATARTWVDLHTSNIKAINSSGMTAAQLFSAIVTNFGAAKGKYSRGEKVFVMNEKTYTALTAAAISIDAQGNIVTGVLDRMPVIGGVIEVLDFVPDNVIIGGFFDLYLLAERAGSKFAQSEHVRFLQDQTVFKGTARYDGLPVIAEGFVAMGINNTTPNASMTFAPDTANQEESE